MRDDELTSPGHGSADSSEPVAVITRPAPDHQSLTQALDARNQRWVHAPAFALNEYGDIDQRLDAVKSCDVVIVTSPATARIVARHVAPSNVASARWIAPGAGTAGVLRAAGFDVRTPESGGTSEDVLTLPELHDVRELTVAIVGAPGGRDAIGRELLRRGAANVKPIHLYQRQPLPAAQTLIDVLQKSERAIVLVSSVRVIEHLFSTTPDALRPTLRECAFVVSSRRTEAACRSHDVRHIVRAAGAGTEALLEGFERLLAMRASTFSMR